MFIKNCYIAINNKNNENLKNIRISAISIWCHDMYYNLQFNTLQWENP